MPPPVPLETPSAPLLDRLAGYRERVNDALQRFLPNTTDARTQLQAAMHYASTNGGKRIRPILTYATGTALQVPLSSLDIPASAVELMHAYSLVHDDLPAMDDDDLRRGKPTVHRQFDEATAILAGDALQALAFTLLSRNPDTTLSDTSKLKMIQVLGDASGIGGMAEGQAIDLESVGCNLTLSELEDMHQHKTGALIRASVLTGAIVGNADSTLTARMECYAESIGLAFQIVDDILDIVSDTETLGKTQGSDMAKNKPTYPSLLGLDGARQHADNMHTQALSSLDGLGPEFDELREISALIVTRSH